MKEKFPNSVAVGLIDEFNIYISGELSVGLQVNLQGMIINPLHKRTEVPTWCVLANVPTQWVWEEEPLCEPTV